MTKTITEAERIARVYREYQENDAVQLRWSTDNPGNQAIFRERQRVLADLLKQSGLLPLQGRRILEIGCGSGAVLASLRNLGAQNTDLYGADLLADRVADAAKTHPTINFLTSNGTSLPFADQQFDFVLIYTVFSSILDADMRNHVATEAWRVLCRGGAIVWYDFRYNNPRNPHVRGQSKQNITELFPHATPHLRTVTLLPPLARRLGIGIELLYPLLSHIPIVRSHYIGVLLRQ